uniref:Uncharacterized protein n=1 Tax=Arundo donax TaxID=35708 RepID=A0A0A8Z3N9_ARUDO
MTGSFYPNQLLLLVWEDVCC